MHKIVHLLVQVKANQVVHDKEKTNGIQLVVNFDKIILIRGIL